MRYKDVASISWKRARGHPIGPDCFPFGLDGSIKMNLHADRTCGRYAPSLMIWRGDYFFRYFLFREMFTLYQHDLPT